MTSAHAPMDWRALAFMGVLMSVECGAVLAASKFIRNEEQQRKDGGCRGT
jgi:hypothetical protein